MCIRRPVYKALCPFHDRGCHGNWFGMDFELSQLYNNNCSYYGTEYLTLNLFQRLYFGHTTSVISVPDNPSAYRPLLCLTFPRWNTPATEDMHALCSHHP